MKSRRRVNFYEAGSGQEVVRVDWFTLLFKVTRINQRFGQLRSWPQSTVRRSSFSSHEVCPQVDARAFRHLNQVSEPALYPFMRICPLIILLPFTASSVDAAREFNPPRRQSFPLVLTSASHLSAIRGRRLEVISPGRLMTQHAPTLNLQFSADRDDGDLAPR